MSTLPWVEKYRPTQLSEIKSHSDVISTIKKFMDQDEFPDLLLYGPPGTGKTSTILCCCQEMFGPSYQTMVIHLNASDERGIDVVRQRIKDFSNAQTFLNLGKFKLVVLDEADAMTEDAQSALQQVIQQSRQNTRYCLICNYVTKIIPSLRSRFVIMRYSPLDDKEVTRLLTKIIKSEELKVHKEAIQAILYIARGDARKAINLLQSCVLHKKTIHKIDIYRVSSKPDAQIFHQQIFNLLHLPFKEAVVSLQNWLSETGVSLIDFMKIFHYEFLQYNLPDKMLEVLLPSLAEIEYHLCFSHTVSIQLHSIVAAFCNARQLQYLI